MKISLALAALAGLSTATLASLPSPLAVQTHSHTETVKRASAVAFLDGVAASYRKLNSLSIKWQGQGGFGADYRWSNDFLQSGTLVWERSTPARVRFENMTRSILFVSDGHRHLIRDGQAKSFESAYDDAVVEFNSIGCDELSKFFLNGKNPLRFQGWSNFESARLLGTATVKGARCHGVELKQVEETRDATTTTLFTVWFDSRHLMRRYQEVSVEKGMKAVVDFEVRPNFKLAPSLFVVPSAPTRLTP